MIEFKGFPAKMQFTPVPNLVLSALLPEITDLAELKVLLHIFELVYLKKGNLRYVTSTELLNNASLRKNKDLTPETLKVALGALDAKSIILFLPLERAGNKEEVYFLNNEANRLAVSEIQRGEISLPDFKYDKNVAFSPVEHPDIFTLYEQNIGMLTPLIADELKEAVKQYPGTWIEEAIKEAASLNKRNWRYIARILEHWSSEGKDDGTYRGNTKENADPDKYIRGKYGHMVQR
jgi:DNA replication protein